MKKKPPPPHENSVTLTIIVAPSPFEEEIGYQFQQVFISALKSTDELERLVCAEAEKLSEYHCSGESRIGSQHEWVIITPGDLCGRKPYVEDSAFCTCGLVQYKERGHAIVDAWQAAFA